MKTVAKMILAAILLVCLLNMPNGYYQFVRLATCIGFSWLAYAEHEQKQPVTTILCILVAILFNPVIKIYMGRETWQMIDVSVAALLIIWAVVNLVYLRNIKSKEDIS